MRRILLTIIGTVGVLSLFIYFGTTNDAELFYYLPSRIFEFAVGYNPKEHKPFVKDLFIYATSYSLH